VFASKCEESIHSGHHRHNAQGGFQAVRTAKRGQGERAGETIPDHAALQPAAAPLRYARADQAIAGLASAQHGVITRTQILRAGVSSAVLDRRVKAKLLRPLHRGVYLVGRLLLPRASALAAVLACGGRALVSHRSAAALWEMLPLRECTPPIDVIVAGGDRRRPRIRICRVSGLRPDEITRRDGIPLTTPARTLFDLAATALERDLDHALAEAFAKRLTSRAELVELLRRHTRHAGARRLRALIGSAEPPITRSEAERRFLSLIRKAKLAAPEVNVRVAGFEVDFYWRVHSLAAEIDGLAFHLTVRRFENDRRRDLELAAAGVRVVRVTWRQIVEEPEALLVRLGQALAVSGRG
jgi:very-short-patch-repair endonuclease